LNRKGFGRKQSWLYAAFGNVEEKDTGNFSQGRRYEAAIRNWHVLNASQKLDRYRPI